jgi:hypothetical protein
MKKLLAVLALGLAFAAQAGDGDGGGREDARYNGGFGPAWYETACGLPCFQTYRLEGSEAHLDPRRIHAAKSPADVRALIAEASNGKSAVTEHKGDFVKRLTRLWRE